MSHRYFDNIIKGMDMPIRIDQVTTTKDLCMFAQVLVGINFGSDLIYALTIEKVRVSYEVEVVYEELSRHCSHCRMVGHAFEVWDAHQQAKSIMPLSLEVEISHGFALPIVIRVVPGIFFFVKASNSG